MIDPNDWNAKTIAEFRANAGRRGTETYRVALRELSGAERDRVYAEQARGFPGFAEYARQTAGVRTIPVLELTRAQP